MKETAYAYAVAYTRALENRMLQRADLEAMLALPSEKDALKYLADKGYGNSGSKTAAGAEEMMKNELEYTWSEVQNACPEGAPIDILLYQNDFHNLKTILKSIFDGSVSGYESLLLGPYITDPAFIYESITTGKTDDFPPLLRDAAKRAYDILASTNDGQLAEIELDKAAFSAMAEVAANSREPFLIGWADLSIALLNMSIALRGAKAKKSKSFLTGAMLKCKNIDNSVLLNAAESGLTEVIAAFTQCGFEDAAKAAEESVSEFERWRDNKRLNYLKAARYKAFGFEPLLGFLVGKQTELQSVRIILSGLRGGIDAETLRGRLRDLYV
ncbi:MAG: V-type ATPase subunit [Oscillospiraceae bacterium]|nr:V-type ATPase subunit [Oscillospiraceae bacterium]